MINQTNVTCSSFIALVLNIIPFHIYLHLSHLGTSLEFHYFRSRAVAFTNSHFHFLIIVESVTSRVALEIQPNDCREVILRRRARRTADVAAVVLTIRPVVCNAKTTFREMAGTTTTKKWSLLFVNTYECNNTILRWNVYKLLSIWDKCIITFEGYVKNRILQ